MKSSWARMLLGSLLSAFSLFLINIGAKGVWGWWKIHNVSRYNYYYFSSSVQSTWLTTEQMLIVYVVLTSIGLFCLWVGISVVKNPRPRN